MMMLTNEMAEKHVGKYIDCYKRRFGYYPMQIIKFPDGSLGLKDATGTCTKIEDEGFNARHYDYIKNSF